ncbi:DUF1176 domain-containing protein [Marinimicrobium agarilyticum]|uniref:DUF1176 domain-containing protein n=1 Tax=Marinimicrobium agarilyticum TaxID=306546 RepID=UPI00048A2CE1|nr:DUF1176 domain-containing protein [Marinimicrobium agarilyticum]
MLNCRYVCILLMSVAVPACAGSEKTAVQPEKAAVKAETSSVNSPTGASSQTLPEDWETLTHSEWLDALDIANCDAENQGSEARRKNWIRLDNSTQLLLLTCGLGAYQDAFHVYTVNVEDKTVAPVMLTPPKDEGGSESGTLVRGTLYKGDEGNVVELLHLSAATGACGWRALYPVDDVKRGGLIKPKQAFCDGDCYNGVTVPDWPEIEGE